jgi:hypothetical protein
VPTDISPPSNPVAEQKSGTIAKEKSTLKLWKKLLGNLRLNEIKPVHVSTLVQAR